MTIKVYLTDSYAKELDARIEGLNGAELVLDKTIFYPEGGGQPSDTGKLVINGASYTVTGLRKEGDDVVHLLDRQPGARNGDRVACAIDWDKRYASMRYHSALHTIDGVIERHYNSGLITGGQIYFDRARIDVDMPDLGKEKVAEILAKANEVAVEGHRISTREIGVEEALKIPRLSRTETGRKLLESLKTVRIVEIEGLDEQADGGTHVKNTKELGLIVLNGYENKGSRRKRIEIKLV